MIPTPIPGMAIRTADKLDACIPKMRSSGGAQLILFETPTNPTACSVYVLRDQRIIWQDLPGLRLFRDISGAVRYSRYCFPRECNFEPGLYSLHWLCEDGRAGVVEFEVSNSPFNPATTITQLEAAGNGYELELVYRGLTIIPANTLEVVLEIPFMLDPVRNKIAWVVTGANNVPLLDVSLEVKAKHDRSWTVQCLPVSTVQRNISWIVF